MWQKIQFVSNLDGKFPDVDLIKELVKIFEEMAVYGFFSYWLTIVLQTLFVKLYLILVLLNLFS